jgi:hypothetical protein
MYEEIRLFLDEGEESKKVKRFEQLLRDRNVPFHIVVACGPNVPALNFEKSWHYGFSNIELFLTSFYFKKFGK